MENNINKRYKSFTSLEQSKKLAEILPIESADMWWNFYSVTTNNTTPQIIHIDTPWVGSFNWNNEPDNIPCWSLAALIDVISKHSSRLEIILRVDKKYNIFAKFDDFIVFRKFVDIDNAIDACYEMIIKLHEQELL